MYDSNPKPRKIRPELMAELLGISPIVYNIKSANKQIRTKGIPIFINLMIPNLA